MSLPDGPEDPTKKAPPERGLRRDRSDRAYSAILPDTQYSTRFGWFWM